MSKDTLHLPPRREGETRQREPVHETRAQDEAHPPAHGEQWDTPWTQPSNLEAPPARPGFVQRWIRVSMHGVDDATNVAKAEREGWRPRRADTAPGEFQVPRIKEGRFEGVIGVHGMILCEMPEGRIAQRREHYAAQTRRQTQAVEYDLDKDFGHPQVPLTKKLETRVALGRRPKVAESEGNDDI